jgi:hypothetical protein
MLLFSLDALSALELPGFAAHSSLSTQTPQQHVRGAQVPKKDRLGREISAAASAGLRRKAAAKRAAGPLGSPLQAGRATTPLSAAGRRLASSLRGHTGGSGGGGGSADAQLRASYGGTPSAAVRRRAGTPGFGTPAGTPAAAGTPLRAGRLPAAAHGAARRLAANGGAGEQDAQTGTAKASLTDNLLNI